MGKKNNLNGYKYRKQGSIDDENFLMLGHVIGDVKNAVDDSKVDLTETNQELEFIQKTLENQSTEINVDLSDTNEKLDDIKNAIENQSVDFNVDLTETNEKLGDIKDAIITQSSEKIQELETQIDELVERVANLESESSDYAKISKSPFQLFMNYHLSSTKTIPAKNGIEVNYTFGISLAGTPKEIFARPYTTSSERAQKYSCLVVSSISVSATGGTLYLYNIGDEDIEGFSIEIMAIYANTTFLEIT